MPGPARLPVAITPFPAAFLRGNDRFHPRPFGMDKNLVRVAAPVRQKLFRRKSVNRSDCPSAIRCRAPCGKSPDRHAMRIRSQMRYFVLSPPLRGSCPDSLLSRPPLWVNPAMTGIDHQPCGVRLFINRNFRRPLSHAIIAPADEASTGVTPSARVGGRIPPRSARAHNPEDRIDKTPVVASSAAPASFTAGQTGLGFFPN